MSDVPDRNLHCHDDEMKKHDREDPVIFGIDTCTHTHKYVPVQGPRGPFLGLFHRKHEAIHSEVKSRGQMLKNKEDVSE